VEVEMNEQQTGSRQPPVLRPSSTIALAAVLLLGLLAAACGSNPVPTRGPSVVPSSPASVSNVPPTAEASPASAVPSGQVVRTIEQPLVPPEVPVAPDSARVDLVMPTFSNPSKITNPLFPVSLQESVLMLGHVDDKPFRTEVTLLPYTRIVEWEGQRVETAVSQYLAYLDGRITEIAYDLYAQADDGSVWYFGEDVADFGGGAIATKEGTWLAGKDAPAAMIMAGQPKVGDVFRTENSPGFAFEEVSVKSVDQTVVGPLGPVRGGIVVSELHMDATTEDKTFAPGYGEFLTTGGGDVEALALAAPTDATPEPMPADLTSLVAGADAIVNAAGSRHWKAASTELRKVTTAWNAYRAGSIPRLIQPVMTGQLRALDQAVAARDAGRSQLAALAVARSGLDLELRYRPVVEVNLARFDLWAAQVIVDAAARDTRAVNLDAFTLVYIRDRILRSVAGADLADINTQLLNLQVAAFEKDLAAATIAASKLRRIVAGTQPVN
jgi:hypothetical protein